MEAISREDRPWGYYEVLMQGPGMQIKRLVVNDMQRLSLQTHEHRDEYWFITAGEGMVQVDDWVHQVKAGSQVTIMRGEKHRVQAIGGQPLEIIEVQHGDPIDENDIVRHEDDYGR
jgi:mannose-6-phosphate isomerase-like protein (cupin superfamily)